MVDFLSPEERSARMSRIRGKDTKPELSLRKVLHRLGFRYRLQQTFKESQILYFPSTRQWFSSTTVSGTGILVAR